MGKTEFHAFYSNLTGSAAILTPEWALISIEGLELVIWRPEGDNQIDSTLRDADAIPIF
jgi:hypothetical protein